MDKQVRILFTLTPPFDPNAGGVQRTTYKLGRYFTEAGHAVGYFSTSQSGHVSIAFGALFHSREKGGAENPQNMRQLVEVIKEFQPDFVINQMPYIKPLRNTLTKNKQHLNYILLGCLRNSLFNFKSNAREVMQRELPSSLFRFLDNPFGMYLVQKRHYISHRKDLKSILKDHDRFILLAPPNNEELKHFVGDYLQEKILAIPNSIPKVFEHIYHKEKIILHVGRIDVHQKRSDLLLPFWERVYRELPDWEFIIIGDGPYLDNIKEEIELKNIPRVSLYGYQKPEPFYERASLFMMPSAYEGFPNTLIEAQSYGCIPFAFDSYSALKWIVRDGADAIISSAFDVQDMANSIISLTRNQKKLAEMREAGLKNAKRFTIEKVGEYWLELFESFKSEN